VQKIKKRIVLIKFKFTVLHDSSRGECSISSISIWILSDTLPVPCQGFTVVFIHEAVKSCLRPEWDRADLWWSDTWE